MAVSLANYPQTSETSNLSEYDDETVSLVSFLPSHTKQPLPRLPIFETVIPQQNGSVTNKNIPSFNKRNSFPRSLPRNPSSTNRHSMCGDLPSQQTNRNSINKSSVKMRRRAASFGENSVIRNNINNKHNNNINSNNLATTDIKNNYTTSLIIQIPSKVDKVESPRSFSRSPNPSPEEKSSPKGKSCTENSTKPATTQNHHIEQKQELLDNNKVETSNNNQNQNEKDFDESSSLDKGHSRTISDDYTKNQNNHIENPQLISNNNSNSNLISQNSKPQSHNRSFFRHNITLNHQASGSSTDLRKSIYKEPSFKKRLRKVFSLTNIRQDNNNNSSNTNSTLSSVSNHKFSSLRGEKHNFTVDNDDNSSNNDKDDDTSVSSVSSNNDNVPVTTQDINNYNKSGSRRRSFIGLFSSKNEKKRNKQNRHQMQQQRHLEQQQSSLDQQNKQLDDNKSNDSTDEIKGDDNNEEKQQNENGNERVDDDPDKKSPIPSQLSSSQSLDNDSPNQFKQKNSTSPLCNQFRINKSSTRPSSLPAPAKDKEPPSSTITPRRLSVPAPLSIIKSDKSDNNQPKQPFVNLGANGTRSVPSLVLLRDTDIPPAPSTPSSIKKLQFSSKLLIHETWTREDYDRRGDQSTCNKLTPLLAQKIKEELNEYKTSEMQVHEDSKNNTHYFA